MDAMPPQAPPAHTSAAHEVAATAFNQLVDIHRWAQGELASMPALPTQADKQAHDPFIAELRAWWSDERRARFSGRLSATLGQLAVLRGEDGTLDSRAVGMVQALASSRGGALPGHLEVSELVFGQVPYAGALVLQDIAQRGDVLLFTADNGWESFADAHALLATVEQRARQRMADDGRLPGISLAQVYRDGRGPWVSMRAVQGEPFDHYVSRVASLQEAKVTQGWVEAGMAAEGGRQSGRFADAMGRALDLAVLFDIESLLAARHARLVTAVNEARLAQVPRDVADAWREAEDDYADLLRVTTEHDAPPPGLVEYASGAITARLATMGVVQAAEEIRVRADYNGDLARRAQSLRTLFEGMPVVYFNLLDLAYQNISAFDKVRLQAVDSEGKEIAALHDMAVRQLIRRSDIATNYQGLLQEHFRTGAEADTRRNGAAATFLARMRLHAAEARLGYFLPGAPSMFLDDHAQRGFRWVEAVLDAPVAAKRRKVEGHAIVARHVMYEGTPVSGILEIGVQRIESVPTIVLYTPDAPDGRAFREFRSRGEAARRFFYNPAFREYLLDRLPNEFAVPSPSGNTRRFTGDTRANWVLGSGNEAGYTMTAAPFTQADITGDVSHALVEVGVQQAVRNVATFSRAANEADWAWLVGWPRDLMFDNLVVNTAKAALYAPAHAAQAAWRMYDNIKAGDHARAFVDFTDFYVASLGVVSPHLIGRGIGQAIVSARFRQGTRLVEGTPVRQPTVVFEAKYEAHGLPRGRGVIDADGLRVIDGQRYLQHDGKTYAVRFDADYGTWRLARPGRPQGWGPAIERTAAGTWGYHRVGLRGGSGRGAGRGVQEARLYDDYTAELERAFPDPVERELVTARMRDELSGRAGGTGLTPTQRAGWDRASWQAHARARDRDLGHPAQRAPLDLSHQAPGAIQVIDPAAAPAELWFYGNRPFRHSNLIRRLGNQGYENYQASLRTEWLDAGFHGVPVTTTTPAGRLAQISAEVGTHLAPGSAFAVRIDPRSLLARLPHLNRGPSAELVSVQTGSGPRLYLRPRGDSPGNLHVGRNEFDVFNRLRDYQGH
ncbi:hypothetical protein FIV34_01805 [Luteibacter pinisoli]|uniref:Dermonecrotic toxin N-terminal domain-containing protein n=1 Tax=Luteibacter pinisoli TaxID=2589080 RepID=A0A4Y5YZL0_9GAMM|nr:DUF6543 domain-containing protein [Luteibacter pinisoli]QDE38016.1 hypothetical protein FIV34_01805 [Luteibacter pinisoli]